MLHVSVRRDDLTLRKSILTALFTLVFLVPLATWNVTGQGMTGRLSGVVDDVSKSIVPSATVVVSNASAKTRDMTVTDGNGNFAFEALPAGEYTLEILKPGFERMVKEGVIINTGKTTSGAYSLNLGRLSETINVTASGYPRRPEASASTTRLKVGGNVQAAKLLKMVRPEYPAAASGAGLEGTVLLDAVIGKDGLPLSLRVANAQVNPELAKAAVEAVNQWRYAPTLLNGEPMEVITRVTINFTLKP